MSSNHELSVISQHETAKESSTTTSSEVSEILQRGPRAAMLIAGLAVGLLFLGWLLFYFILFMRRGYVG
jgi:hypothetical protein